MSESNFQKVKEFHKTFGLRVESKFDETVLEDEKTVKLRLDLIEEEFNELKEAIKNKDIREVGDALEDILYVTYGAIVSFGFDGDKGFDLVHKSNMTKACKDEDEAKATVESYRNDKRYDSPTYRKSGNYYVVYNESSGKILKSINYKPVDQDAIIS
jgi:predicted HAD superfamily Cof-like phosphohydrolase